MNRPFYYRLAFLSVVATLLSGCVGYHDHDHHPDHPHGCPPGLAKQGRCNPHHW